MNEIVQAATQEEALSFDWSNLSDDDLRFVIAEAQRHLEARENARVKDAIAEIKRIARENEIDVAVGRNARRRKRTKRKTIAQ